MKLNLKLTLNFFAVLVAVACLLQAPAFAAVGAYEDDVRIGNAADINVGNGLEAEMESGKKRLKISAFAGDLIANGRGTSGSTEMQSSSTRIWPNNLAGAVINKRVGGAGGVDESNGGTILQDGLVGQTITLRVIQLQTNGSWVITPVTKTNYSTITLNALYESVTLLFVDTTVGWVVVGGSLTPVVA